MFELVTTGERAGDVVKSTLQILIEGRNLIASPNNWTFGVLACDSDGVPVGESDERAVKFCSVGALCRIIVDDLDAFEDAKMILEKHMGFSISGFNDTHTHSEVLNAWDKAIIEAGS